MVVLVSGSSQAETESRKTGYGPHCGGGWLREPPARPEPAMTLPRTVADVLADHVVFEIECIDRMYCNVYVPQLQHAGGLLGYI